MKYEIGSITKMGMLEHVLLTYANETLNGYCYVNIILDYFILIFYFAILFLGIDNKKSDWGLGEFRRRNIFKICHAIDNNALLSGLISFRAP